jgi:hypothetical protein
MVVGTTIQNEEWKKISGAYYMRMYNALSNCEGDGRMVVVVGVSSMVG